MRIESSLKPLSLVLAAALAGCSDDGTTTNSTDGTTTDAATTGPAPDSSTGAPPPTTTTVDPTTAGPTTDPVTTDPVTTDPVTTDPVTTDPVTTDPVTTEPDPSTGTTDPGSSSDTGSSSGGAVCGDGEVEGDETCDDGPANADDAACTSQCALAACGDGLVLAGGEDCDDGGESATCDVDCTPAECGDGTVNLAAAELCDEAGESDACDADCTLAECGDNVINASAGETCDDGNVVADDGCSPTCETETVEIGDIVLGGSNFVHVKAALDAMAVTYAEQPQMFVPPNAGDVIILANDGGSDAPPDYNPHFDAGNHLLIFGGSGLDAYGAFVATYFTSTYTGWHQSSDCVDDWTKTTPHPLNALLPATWNFVSQELSYHMFHLADAGQPAGVTLLGRTCHAAPNNHVLAVRKYPSGGSFVYMALDLGAYTDATAQAGFVVPFLTGYFDWLEAGAP